MNILWINICTAMELLLTTGTSCHAKSPAVCHGCFCLSLFSQEPRLCTGLGIFSAASYLEIKSYFSPKFTYIGLHTLMTEHTIYQQSFLYDEYVCVCVRVRPCLCLFSFHLWNVSRLTSEICGESKGHWGHTGLCLQTSFQLLHKQEVVCD